MFANVDENTGEQKISVIDKRRDSQTATVVVDEPLEVVGQSQEVQQQVTQVAITTKESVTVVPHKVEDTKSLETQQDVQPFSVEEHISTVKIEVEQQSADIPKIILPEEQSETTKVIPRKLKFNQYIFQEIQAEVSTTVEVITPSEPVLSPEDEELKVYES